MLRWKEKKQSQLDHLGQCIDRLECKIFEEAESMDKKEYEYIFRERELMEHVYKQNKMIPVWPSILRSFLNCCFHKVSLFSELSHRLSIS
ncbi:hypothetical protein [Methanolobus psychrotolerans]|uniref:hypothetical protein n=1 Tax=Methanolobus psychrotolerans TaxID=1874706 RepID=UPI0013EAC69B|nr:hypothetical protein [Methanolobus psychrotolerans]